MLKLAKRDENQTENEYVVFNTSNNEIVANIELKADKWLVYWENTAFSTCGISEHVSLYGVTQEIQGVNNRKVLIESHVESKLIPNIKDHVEMSSEILKDESKVTSDETPKRSEYQRISEVMNEFYEIVEDGLIDKLIDLCAGEFDLNDLEPQDIKMIQLMPVLIRIKAGLQ